MGGLDLSFVNWDIISKFVVNGFWFSVQLTIVATVGGIIFGTILALMRLSGNKVLMLPATIYVNGMRSIPLVMVILWFYLLVPTLIGRATKTNADGPNCCGALDSTEHFLDLGPSGEVGQDRSWLRRREDDVEVPHGVGASTE